MNDAVEFGDPLSQAFWEAARRHTLAVQRCRACGQHQFYPRPFCISCSDSDLEWVDTSGAGTVYSVTTVHLSVRPDLEPPYQVAIVELDEGPRFLASIEGRAAAIGDRVEVAWRERPEAPPLPVFRCAGAPAG